MRNIKRRIFRRKGYLLILPPVLAWPVMQAQAVQTCQGDQVTTSCQASRQSLSGGSAEWRVADDQWLIFQDVNENTSGGAVFLAGGARFSVSPENNNGMTLFANNHVSGEYNNGGAIFAKENATIDLDHAIFSNNIAGGYGGAIYSGGTNDSGDADLIATNTLFIGNIAHDGKGGAIYSINNSNYFSDDVFDNNQAYTSTTYSDGDGGALDVTDNESDTSHLSGVTVINNTRFTNNVAEGEGGAIYTNSASDPYIIDISLDDSYQQNGGVLINNNNSAQGYSGSASSAAGGFMYVGNSNVEFDIAANKTMVIGDLANDGAIDSIAGTGLITKTGAGELVLNADNNDFTGEMTIQNGEVTLGRDNSLMHVGDTHCQSDPQNCFGLQIGAPLKADNQAELNVGNTQQTFVHSLTGFENGVLHIDDGGNVTVNSGAFSGTIEGAGQLTVAQNGSYTLAGAASMALTGDVVVEDNGVLSLVGDQNDLQAMQADPQSIVLNDGVLDLSDYTTYDGENAANDGLAISGSGGTVIGQNDVVDISGGENTHIAGDGVYVVINAGDQRVSLANDNSYLGDTQIASGVLEVSDNSQLGNTDYNRSLIFTNPQQHSELDVTADVDTRSATAGHARDIEMRADGEVRVEEGVDTQWGGLMADSTGVQQDSNSTFSKTGAGTLELTASGTATSAVRVEEGTLKGDAVDIIPYASSLWVGEGAIFETGMDQNVQSIDTTSAGTVDITDGSVLRLTHQDTASALDASIFSGTGTLVNATDGVTLSGTLDTNLQTDSVTNLAGVTVDGNLTNTSGTINLANGMAGDTLTVNGDYIGGGTLVMDSELNGDDSASDMLVLNGNTSGTTTVMVDPISGIGQPTATGIKVVDFTADPGSYQNQAQFSLAGNGYINMGAYDYTLVEDNNDWYLRSQQIAPPTPPDPPEPPTPPDPPAPPMPPDPPAPPAPPAPPLPPDPDPDPTPDPTPAFEPVLNAKTGGYLNNLRAANQAFVMERRDHAGADRQPLYLRIVGGRRDSTLADQLAQHEDFSTVQLSGNIMTRKMDDDGLWMLGVVGGYSDNQGESRSTITHTHADNSNHGYSLGVTTTWLQHGFDRHGAWLDSWLQYAWFDNQVSESQAGEDRYHSNGVLASLEGGYQWPLGNGFLLEPQAQVISQGVKQADFTAANHSRVEQRQGDDVQMRLGLHSEWRIPSASTLHITPTLDFNYLREPHAAALDEDGSTITDDAGDTRGEVKMGIQAALSPRMSLRANVAWQKGTQDFSQTAGYLSFTAKW